MLMIVPSHLNGLLLACTLPFFPRHGDGGWETDQGDSDAKEFSFWYDPYLIQPIAQPIGRNQSQSAVKF